jgi:hypothetical protein
MLGAFVGLRWHGVGVLVRLRRDFKIPTSRKDARNGAPGKVKIQVDFQVNFKGNGQECLFYTSRGVASLR